jgi:hypothetical protein
MLCGRRNPPEMKMKLNNCFYVIVECLRGRDFEYCDVDLFDVELEAGPLADREWGYSNTSIHEL